MNTWTKETVPVLPTPTLFGRVAGAIRLVCLLGLTVLCVLLFLLGRFLRGVLGKWIGFHFTIARLWAVACLWLCGLKLRIQGEPIRGGALVANHSSWADIIALRATTLMYFVSKAEVANWPGVGFVTRITGTVFIERKRTEVKRQEGVLRSRIAQNQLLCLFPEGTSTDGRRVLPFKSTLFGAFFEGGLKERLSVQPVSVIYHAPDGADPRFYGWWGAMDFGSHLFKLLATLRGGAVTVVFHKPVRVAEAGDRKVLSAVMEATVRRGVEDRLTRGS